MKKTLLTISFIAGMLAGQAQKVSLYHPEDNASVEIDKAIEKARQEHKHVFIQVGGNWCSWCILFNGFVTQDPSLDSLLKADYIVYHLNYSQENKNEKLLAKYGFPQRFGFPVFLILDEKGNRLHTQNSEYLEEGHGYNKKKVTDFFHAWSVAALDPAQYNK